MNINTIKNAIEHYMSTEDCLASQAETVRCMHALEEIACVMDRYSNSDVWNNEGYLLNADTWCGILNEMAYDDMGRCKRVWGRDVKESHFYHMFRKNHMYELEEVPNKYLRLGYETLGDLWDDNEVAGDNDELGYFRGLQYTKEQRDWALGFFVANDPNGEYSYEDMCENPLEYVEILKQWFDDMGDDVTDQDLKMFCKITAILHDLAAN